MTSSSLLDFLRENLSRSLAEERVVAILASAMTNGVSLLLVLGLCASTVSAFSRPPATTALARALATFPRSPADHLRSATGIRANSFVDDDDDDDVFADIFAARDARREMIKEKAAEMAAALQLEEKLVAADDAEGRLLDGPAETTEVEEEAVEDDDDELEFYNAAELFQILDKDSDGELTKAEVIAGAEELELTEEEAAELFDELDVNGDGVLSLGELQLLTNENLNDDDNYADDAPNSGGINVYELFDKMFKLADADDSGGIDLNEFRQLFALLSVISGESVNDEAAEAKMLSVFKSMDTDGSGTVEVKELRDFISSSAAVEWPELFDEVLTWDK